MNKAANTKRHDTIQQMGAYLMYAFFAIVFLMPFHALFTTWIGSSFSSDATRDIIKAWKEILIFVLSLPTLYILVKKPNIREKLVARGVNQLIILYGMLHLIIIMVMRPQTDAAIVSLMINLRFLAFFMLAQLLVLILRSPKKLENIYERIIFITSVSVGLFGMAQIFVLPNDWLTHFGYGSESIPPYIPIDQNPDFLRFSSTLRGPNPLGAFMILPITAAAWLLYKTKKKFYLAMLVPLVFAEAMSLSRSAWVGAALAIVVLVCANLSKENLKRAVVVGATVVVLAVSSLLVFKDTDTIQNLVFHEDPESTSQRVESNVEHVDSIKDGLGDIVSQPLGAGPGTAGPASFFNEEESRISENYFIQIGQEVGILGLMLFVAICVKVAMSLWRQRSKNWQLILFASFIGLTFVSLLLHGWADESVALTWWGFAGLLYKE